jgi:purine-nucleoside phosphorylase
VSTAGTADEQYARVDAAAAYLTRALGEVPETAIVLGSGLGSVGGRVDDRVLLSYTDIPGWPAPTVAGHAGRLIAGQLHGRPLLILSGRIHLYEGRSATEIAFPVRAIGRAGVRQLILTNAAGGINPAFVPGTLMVIDDHINLTGHNPLAGPNDARFGPRFPDMTELYAWRLRRIADEASVQAGVPVVHGVYVGVLGPSYETPAEIRAFRTLGGDAVGMSTVAEAMVACHMGIEVLGLSCIANAAAGLHTGPLSETDVLDRAAGSADRVTALLEQIVVRL